MNEEPDMELIVVHMNEESYTLPPTGFPVHSFSFSSEESLPLAKARNFALSRANADNCIFLDVDCIPSQDFIKKYLEAFTAQDILWSGDIRYLNTSNLPALDATTLNKLSKADPIRGELESMPYELFWSLNFGCSKAVFANIGGFDEDYRGYGAEDTDFAFKARTQGVELGMIDASAYHQPHASYSPPLNHLEDIISNAKIFHEKWKQWPMEGWLKKFEEMGYISWSKDQLQLISYPDQSVIERYRK